MEFDDFEELAKLAYKQEELSDFAPLPVKYMYLRLCMLYDAFARGQFTKEQCVQMKNQLRKEHRGNMIEHTRDMECHREYLLNRKQNTELLMKLEKSHNKEEMLDFCLKIVSNCLNDKSLYERNKAKGEQLAF